MCRSRSSRKSSVVRITCVAVAIQGDQVVGAGKRDELLLFGSQVLAKPRRIRGLDDGVEAALEDQGGDARSSVRGA